MAQAIARRPTDRPEEPDLTPWLVGLGALAVGVLSFAVWRRMRPMLPSPILAIQNPPESVLTASAFLTAVEKSDLAARERAIVAAANSGQVPDEFRSFMPVFVSANGHQGVFWISSSHLVIGTSDDPFYAPLTVGSAQQIADHYGWLLPTHKMVNAAYHAHDAIRVPFKGYLPEVGHRKLSTYLDSSRVIQSRIAGRTGLKVGYAKPYVITNRREGHEDLIAIMGAYDSSGKPLQPFQLPHGLGHVDYSQQPEYVLPDVLVDGAWMSLSDALANPVTASIFSDDNAFNGGRGDVIPVSLQRYPT